MWPRGQLSAPNLFDIHLIDVLRICNSFRFAAAAAAAAALLQHQVLTKKQQEMI